MKPIFVLLLLLPIICNGQHAFPIDSATGKILYSGIFTVDSASKLNLYVTAKDCILKAYLNPIAKLQYEDKEAGRIVYQVSEEITSSALLNPLVVGKVSYLITISVKENKYKYEITHFYYANILEEPPVTFESMFPDFTTTAQLKLIKGYYEQLNSDIQRFIKRLNSNMPKANALVEW